MSRRRADVDLTEEEGPLREEELGGPNQWREWMTCMIIGAWIWLGQQFGGRRPDSSVEDWGEELVANTHLKFLVRRDAVIQELLPSDHPFIQQKFTWEPTPLWRPRADYTYYFMRSQQADSVNLNLLAVAELRWLASGGILSMDSHANITAHNNRILAQNRPKNQEEKPGETTRRKNRRVPRMQCTPGPPADRISASRVDSIPPTQESVDLLACLENWNDNQLPEELQKRPGGLTKKLGDRQFPKALLHILVEYTLATWVHLVISSTCPYLDTRCHFGSTRRLRISVDTDIRAVLYSFLYATDFVLMARDTQGKLHDFSVLSSLPARDLCMFGEREIPLQVQAKLQFSHACAACGKSFRCIPQGYPAPADCEAPPDNREGCECLCVDGDIWYCSNDCYFEG